MQIHLVCLGTLKETYLKNAQDELLGILARKNIITGCQVIELKEEPLKDNASPAQIEAALLIEAQRILEKIPAQARVICLDIGGKPATESFFRELRQAMGQNQGQDIVFLIGGSNGIHQSVKNKAQHRISFSGLTFPHQLFRVALLEAIARYL